MKKKRFALSMMVAICVCSAYGCSEKTESKQEATTVSVEKESQKINIRNERPEVSNLSIDEELANINWNEGYVDKKIAAGVYVDAEVPKQSDWDNEFGLYHYTIKELDTTEDTQIKDDLAKFMTKNGTKYKNDTKNKIYSFGGKHSWFIDADDIDYGEVMADALYPIYTDDYELNDFLTPIDTFWNELGKYTALNRENSKVKYKYYGNKYRNAVNKRCQMNGESADMPQTRDYLSVEYIRSLDNNTEISANFTTEIKEPKKMEGEVLNPLLEESDGKLIPRYYATQLRFSINVEGKFTEIDYLDCGMEVEKEPFSKVRILSPDKIIKKAVSSIKTQNNITIKRIELLYLPYISETLDENNMRDVYLAPYWRVTYNIKEYGICYSQMYVAETGEKVDDMRDLKLNKQ